MATGDSGCEAYTAIAWGVGLSHERSDSAGAEGFHSLEGNMCGTVMRGADALPGSKATSRAKGSHRNLGGLGSGRQMLRERDGPHREGEEPKPMMHGHEKSDLVIVAVKPTNKARKAPCGGSRQRGRSGARAADGDADDRLSYCAFGGRDIVPNGTISPWSQRRRVCRGSKRCNRISLCRRRI